MAKFTKPLTEQEIKKAKSQDKAYTLFDGQGVFLEVSNISAI